MASGICWEQPRKPGLAVDTVMDFGAQPLGVWANYLPIGRGGKRPLSCYNQGLHVDPACGCLDRSRTTATKEGKRDARFLNTAGSSFSLQQEKAVSSLQNFCFESRRRKKHPWMVTRNLLWKGELSPSPHRGASRENRMASKGPGCHKGRASHNGAEDGWKR